MKIKFRQVLVFAMYALMILSFVCTVEYWHAEIFRWVFLATMALALIEIGATWRDRINDEKYGQKRWKRWVSLIATVVIMLSFLFDGICYGFGWDRVSAGEYIVFRTMRFIGMTAMLFSLTDVKDKRTKIMEESNMEIIHYYTPGRPVRAVLFDFDGTISTLRFGWEQVMKPLMLEMISGGKDWDDALEAEVDAYIDESTGIQTIHQMKWLAETVHARGSNPDAPTDPWWYKAEYNRRLMENIRARLDRLNRGEAAREDYMMQGSEALLQALTERGVKLYVASGTDHPDVVNEIAALGLTKYFTHVAGAPVGEENCSKEKVIAQLMQDEGLSGADFAVVGDGKVEIRLGRNAEARTIGIASDEAKRCGVNPVKRDRLIKAGADVIIGDFTDLNAILAFLELE